jgi:hypothetical protein
VIRRALLPGLLLLLSLGAQGSGGATAPGRTLVLAGPVKELAADGGRVAVILTTKRATCSRDRAAVWTPSTRSLVPVGAAPCSESLSTGAGFFGLALADTRFAYVLFGGGNIRELQLRAGTLARPRPATVASASFGLGDGEGTYLGNLLGDGSLLVFNGWDATGVESAAVLRLVPAGGQCPDGDLGSARRCATVRSAAGEAVAVDTGRIVLRDATGTLQVVRPNGTLVRSVAAPQIRAAKLQGDDLVVLVPAAPRRFRLDVFSLLTGAKTQSWPLAGPAASAGDGRCGDPEGCRTPALRLEDVQNGLAVYELGRSIHLLRLSDGRDVVFRTPAEGPVHAQLEAPGLFYSYRLSSSTMPGRVAFVPFATLLARLG